MRIIICDWKFEFEAEPLHNNISSAARSAKSKAFTEVSSAIVPEGRGEWRGIRIGPTIRSSLQLVKMKLLKIP
jgi:hypothetical protein